MVEGSVLYAAFARLALSFFEAYTWYRTANTKRWELSRGVAHRLGLSLRAGIALCA
jgi:hypothetical protein